MQCSSPTRAVTHHCGLFGAANHPQAAQLTYFGMYAQQHRGQEAAGICSANGEKIIRRAGEGLVTQAFSDDDLAALANPFAIGHVRYSTTGGGSTANIQPLMLSGALGDVAICHNGNLTNAVSIRREYESRGALFLTSSDTEVILHMLADKEFALQPDPLASVMRRLRGSFCLLFLYPDRIEAVRDSSGNRPLCLGKVDDSFVVCSETCALDINCAEFVREIEPGEIVTISRNGITSRFFTEKDKTVPARCIFEQVYFADPSSRIFGENVHEVRRKMGAQLAREAPVAGDLVIAVPNCARCAALGYHEESDIPIGRGFTTNHYVGRSFIQPSQAVRDLTVRMKLNVIRESVAGKRLIVVEDSVVRGTTTRGKMDALRQAGAKEIHLRVASPPIKHPCYYGIDFPNREELIANECTVEQIRERLEVDSLAYLSLDGMLQCVRHAPNTYCTACFSGQYPIPIEKVFQKDIFENNQLKFFDRERDAAQAAQEESKT